MVSYLDFQPKATTLEFQGAYDKAKLYCDETGALGRPLGRA